MRDMPGRSTRQIHWLFQIHHFTGLVEGRSAQLVEIDAASTGFAGAVAAVPAEVVHAFSGLEAFNHLAGPQKLKLTVSQSWFRYVGSAASKQA